LQRYVQGGREKKGGSCGHGRGCGLCSSTCSTPKARGSLFHRFRTKEMLGGFAAGDNALQKTELESKGYSFPRAGLRAEQEARKESRTPGNVWCWWIPLPLKSRGVLVLEFDAFTCYIPRYGHCTGSHIQSTCKHHSADCLL
jgi:hypothetical protein